MVGQVVVDRAGMTSVLGCSITYPDRLGQLEVWKGYGAKQDWQNIEIKVNPTQVCDHLPYPVYW